VWPLTPPDRSGRGRCAQSLLPAYCWTEGQPGSAKSTSWSSERRGAWELGMATKDAKDLGDAVGEGWGGSVLPHPACQRYHER
jgi:hypothetical protein